MDAPKEWGGGKLAMGPLWDYDNAFGMYIRKGSESPYGFWVKNQPWYERLFEDEEFVKKVKERFLFFYSQKENLMYEANAMANYLARSIEENNNKWSVLYAETGSDNNMHPSIWGSYLNEVTSLKMWLSQRMDWLNEAINNL